MGIAGNGSLLVLTVAPGRSTPNGNSSTTAGDLKKAGFDSVAPHAWHGKQLLGAAAALLRTYTQPAPNVHASTSRPTRRIAPPALCATPRLAPSSPRP